MAFVKLNIIEPINNLAFEGMGAVGFLGEVVEMPDEVQSELLYYRWYSSLYEPEWSDPENPDYFSIERNVQNHADEEFTWLLDIGSHAITFAVSDRSTETKDDLMIIEHGGVTGGAEEGPGQCLVHVFKATLLDPEGDLNNLPSGDLRLIAQAPAAWGKPIPETDQFEVNEDYHAYNRLRYRWEIIPDDAAAQGFEYALEPEDMDFGFYSDFNQDIEPTTEDDPNPDDVFVICFEPPVEDLNLLSDGGYTLSLHVEDKLQGENIGHDENSIHVTIQT